MIIGITPDSFYDTIGEIWVYKWIVEAYKDTSRDNMS